MHTTPNRLFPGKAVAFWLVANFAVAVVLAYEFAQVVQPPRQETTAERLSPMYASSWRGPEVGDQAPDFSLTTADGGRTISLSDYVGKKPVVLAFGSYTCPIFRRRAAVLNAAYEQYKDDFEFLLVYVREAHPVGSGPISENHSIGQIPSPTNSEERAQLAKICADNLGFRMPLLLDDMDNSTEQQYQSWPEKLYVIDADGRIAFAGIGPGDVRVAGIGAMLENMRAQAGAE